MPKLFSFSVLMKEKGYVLSEAGYQVNTYNGGYPELTTTV